MIAEATQKHGDFEKALADRKTQPPKAGDSFSFNFGEDCLYPFWVLVHQHPDDPEMWYLVCDDGSGAPLVGSLDVEVSETDLCGPTVIRANCGLWAKLKSIEVKGQRSSFVQDEYVARTRHVLARLARGQKPNSVSPEQEECDYDPDYEDLIDEINVVRTALDKMLNG